MEFKVALVGGKAVGKTTFIKRLQTGVFEKEYKPTIGYQDYKLSFDTNIGEVHFLVRDCGFETVSVADMDGVIIVHGDNCKSNYSDGIRDISKTIPILLRKNDQLNTDNRNKLMKPFLKLLRFLKGNGGIEFIDKPVVNKIGSGIEIEKYDDDKELYKTKEHNFIVRPHPTDDDIIYVIGKLNSDNKIIELTKEEINMAAKIGFIYKVPEITNFVEHELNYLEYLAPLCDAINSTTPHKIHRVSYPGGLFKITCDFFEHGNIIEEKSVQYPSKIFWASRIDGMIRVVYQFQKVNGVYEQTD